MDADKQKRIALLIGAGAVLFFVGLLLWFMMLGGGAAAAAKQGDPTMLLYSGLPLGITFIGLIVASIGLYMGWKSAFVDHSIMPLHEVPNVYIIAALIMDKQGERVFDEDMHAPEDIRRYVQVRFPDGTARELETAQEVFHGLGEGQQGLASIQGQWLSKFVPNRPSS